MTLSRYSTEELQEELKKREGENPDDIVSVKIFKEDIDGQHYQITMDGLGPRGSVVEVLEQLSTWFKYEVKKGRHWTD